MERNLVDRLYAVYYESGEKEQIDLARVMCYDKKGKYLGNGVQPEYLANCLKKGLPLIIAKEIDSRKIVKILDTKRIVKIEAVN